MVDEYSARGLTKNFVGRFLEFHTFCLNVHFINFNVLLFFVISWLRKVFQERSCVMCTSKYFTDIVMNFIGFFSL